MLHQQNLGFVMLRRWLQKKRLQGGRCKIEPSTFAAGARRGLQDAGAVLHLRAEKAAGAAAAAVAPTCHSGHSRR